MQLTIPRVERGHLYPSGRGAVPIVLGTRAWYGWLEQHTAFLFRDLDGVFTVHKSGTSPHEQEWQASCVRRGKLSHLWLGPSHTLTLSRLQAVARSLAGEQAPAEQTALSPAPPAACQPSVPKPAAPLGSASALLRTKLYRPRLNSDMIARPRLLERLSAGLSGTVTLLCAPAGFGKTTLLADWLQTLPQQAAWLTLDETDNEVALFVHGLIAALHTVWPDACPATASLLSAPHFPPPEHVATLLSNELADVPDDVVLVLDDYHLIRSSEVHALLDVLIEHLPSQVHLVLATRSDPPLPLIRWLAKGYLNELRGADLRFTLAETEAFLSLVVGQDLAQQTAAALQDWTGGWIAVGRLLALSLRRAANREAVLDRMGQEPERSVSRYLLEELLAQQAPAVQGVLMRMAILEQFCLPLCVAISGEGATPEQVQATLDWLEASNVFLVPLDEQQQWYRLHPLFQLLVRQQLQGQLSPEERASLHLRASAWYDAQGLLEPAIQHALAAGQGEEAARLVEAHVLVAFEQEQWRQMERWLGLLPEQQIQGRPGLLLARAWIVQARGQLQDLPAVLRAAQQLLGSPANGAPAAQDGQARILRALNAVLWSQFHYFTGQAQASLQSAHAALERIRPGEGYIASHALYFLALSNQASGHEDVALEALNNALREPAHHLNEIARLLLAQASVYLAAGKLQQVDCTARHLLRLAQEADLALSQYWAHWLLGYVYYEWNNLYMAAYHFSIVVANRHRAHFWAVQEAMYGLALAYQAQGLGKEAQETAGALLDWVRAEHNMQELLTAYAFCGQLALVQDEVEKVEAWLELAGEQEGLGPMLFFEDPALTRAWMLLAKGDAPSVARGQALLTHLLQHVKAIHSTRKTINVLALQAWAYDLQGHLPEALEALEQALLLACPAGFIRTFADVPALAQVLQQLRKRRKARQQGEAKLDAYLQRILAAMSPMPAQAVSTEGLMRQEGLEPLTQRELQLLHWLDKDLSNKEIARELVVTPGTVKVHTTNLYRKLSVNNRRAAVTLAKALGLLASDQASTPRLLLR
jgi:LuxR family transcriptional regulator, maltose regulon positive regulatory protein